MNAALCFILLSYGLFYLIKLWWNRMCSVSDAVTKVKSKVDLIVLCLVNKKQIKADTIFQQLKYATYCDV